MSPDHRSQEFQFYSSAIALEESHGPLRLASPSFYSRRCLVPGLYFAGSFGECQFSIGTGKCSGPMANPAESDAYQSSSCDATSQRKGVDCLRLGQFAYEFQLASCDF